MKVSHRNGSYEVSFTGLDEALNAVPREARYITDSSVSRIYGDRLPGERTLIVPSGEGSKSIELFDSCLEGLARLGTRRTQPIVAFGGGVVGDLAGFVASAYMRGVPFIQIPTTLLAQVDSSIGGKVGVDLKAGKNLAGAFYPPQAVYICLEVLETLEERQFNNGMAEVWKYGFIHDADFVDRLRRLVPKHDNFRDMRGVVERCLQIKSAIVAEDEFELKGIRAKLNFGHTVGHAIEHMNHYRNVLHGEAISVGMVVEARLGEHLGVTQPGTAEIVLECLKVQGLPVVWNDDWLPQELIDSMQRDKKRTDDALTFSLLGRIGECKLVSGVHANAVVSALSSI